jgi:hypothetical protein
MMLVVRGSNMDWRVEAAAVTADEAGARLCRACTCAVSSAALLSCPSGSELTALTGVAVKADAIGSPAALTCEVQQSTRLQKFFLARRLKSAPLACESARPASTAQSTNR